MPIIIALAIRAVIQAAVTLGIMSLAEKVILPLVNVAIAKAIELFGVSEEDATSFVANGVIGAAENIGILALTLRTKLPTSVAERLGFTSKGFNKRPYTKAGEAKLPKVANVVAAAGPATAEEVAAIAETVASARKIPVSKVKVTLDYVMKILGLGFLGTMVISNVIDFGNWNNGAYQKTLQRLIAVVTFGLLVPDPKVPKSSVLSSDVWNRTYSTYIELGAVGINDPYKMMTVLFTRQNLIDLVDKIAAHEVANGNTIGLKQILAATALMVILKDTEQAPVVAATQIVTPQVSQVRVFSGVVSQGVIGSTASFTPRQDDLIENAEELSQASHNNLAPFLAALPSRMSYEIKVVPSVKSASGFTQRGTAQRIVSGYNKDGSPKYRTVVNKFATMDIFVKTDKGSQTKITTIVLGPVDSVKFQGANVNLGQVAVDVQQNIAAPVSLATPAPANASVPIVAIHPTGVFMDHNPPLFSTLYKLINGRRAIFDPYGELTTAEEKQKLSQDPSKFAQNEQRLKDHGVITSEISTVQYIADKQPGETGPGLGGLSFTEFFGATPSVGVVAPAVAPVVIQANTLFEYYQSQGKSLPSVEERSKIYEQLALGQAAYYTGTAEQNTKLLAALQGSRL